MKPILPILLLCSCTFPSVPVQDCDTLKITDIGGNNLVIEGNKEADIYIDMDSIKVLISNDTVIWQSHRQNE